MKNPNFKESLSDKRNRQIYEQLWLTYFSNTLLRKGLITKEQWNKMHLKIKLHTSSAGR